LRFLGSVDAGFSVPGRSVEETPMNSLTALLIVLCVIVCTIGLGIFGVRKIRMSPSQFILGGRSFGVIFLWLLSAGEIYTSFTFLGAAGWAYGKGAPAFYIICYLTISCITFFSIFLRFGASLSDKDYLRTRIISGTNIRARPWDS
jgi:Na+/proline symporter